MPNLKRSTPSPRKHSSKKLASPSKLSPRRPIGPSTSSPRKPTGPSTPSPKKSANLSPTSPRKSLSPNKLSSPAAGSQGSLPITNFTVDCRLSSPREWAGLSQNSLKTLSTPGVFLDDEVVGWLLW
jgi:hypothetical protein